VARDQVGDQIGADRATDARAAPGLPMRVADVVVGDQRARRDAEQRLPDLELERRARQEQAQGTRVRRVSVLPVSGAKMRAARRSISPSSSTKRARAYGAPPPRARRRRRPDRRTPSRRCPAPSSGSALATASRPRRDGSHALALGLVLARVAARRDEQSCRRPGPDRPASNEASSTLGRAGERRLGRAASQILEKFLRAHPDHAREHARHWKGSCRPPWRRRPAGWSSTLASMKSSARAID